MIMSDKQFVNLHNHSFYSLGDSISAPEDMAKQAKALGMNAMAITEHGTLASWLQFRDACKKYNIKPIFGLEAYFVDDVTEIYGIKVEIDELKLKIKALNKDKTKKGQKVVSAENEHLEALTATRNKLKKYNHLILLAKNFEGCMNLMKIHNDSVIDGIYFKPRMDWAVLEKHKGGIIATTACLGGRICKLLEHDNILEAKQTVERFKSIFGPGNFFLELQLHDIKLQTETNHKLIKLAEATETPCVVTCDTHYTEEGQHSTRGLIRQLDKDPDEINNDDQLTDLFIKNEEMLLASWRKYMPGVSANILAQAILNTRAIADQIEIFPLDNSLKFPTFETGGLSQEAFLTKQAWAGLSAKNLQEKPEYVERLELELSTINTLGFASYFNVVADLIRHARESQPVGIGRGSVGGSLLAYLIGISGVDPIEFALYFERFLDRTKGVIAPSFGLELSNISYDYEKILGDCQCHQH